MKNKFWLVYTIFLASSLVAINLVCASEEGSSGRGGGDPTIMRARLIREFIERDLKTEVRSAWKKLRFRSIPDPKTANAIEDMDTKGFLNDLNSPYIVANECYAMDEQGAKVKKPASAEMNKRNGPICFDVGILASQNVSKEELIALAIHEHSHHFGYLDLDHAIAREVLAQDYSVPENDSIKSNDFIGQYKLKAADPAMPSSWECAPQIDISSWKTADLFIVFKRSSTDTKRIQPDFWLAGGFDYVPDDSDIEANAPYVWNPDGRSRRFSNDPAQSNQWGPYTDGRHLSKLEGRVLSRAVEWRKCHSDDFWDKCGSYALPAHQEIRLMHNGEITVTTEFYRVGEKTNYRTSCKYKKFTK